VFGCPEKIGPFVHVFASVLPKLRRDLTIREQSTANGTFFVVKDPVTEDFYRFGEAERFIAEQFDGATPVEAVRGASADPLERAKPNPLLAKRTLRALLLGAVALPILFLGRMELKIRGQFNALPIRNADVRAEVEGIVQEIYVDEGDQVREGERIDSLTDRDLRTELRKTEAGIEQSKARL